MTPLRPHILISNDDGVTAPGLVSLATLLHQENFCDFSVCGPSGERSAQSHSINIHHPLHAFPISVPGAEEAWAVSGTPADSVMLALYGPLLKNNKFDLVVSGINRGDNCGLHIIYSGTVGAAREAACKGVPSIALSLDNHSARSVEGFAQAARHGVVLIKAVLGLLPGSTSLLEPLSGHLLNINVPEGEARGYCLAHQGRQCLLPLFTEAGPREDVDLAEALAVAGPGVVLRAFNNVGGDFRRDEEEGTDSWAVSRRWISVTPLGLLSDLPGSAAAAAARCDPRLLGELRAALTGAARAAGVECLVPDGRALM
ncbi:hypothetical protein ACKKBF_B31800 [Auxenochlorella protothecoides x Auxenochlorella symbiontica]